MMGPLSRRARKGGRGRAEVGTASAELVLLVVPIIVLVAFAVFAGRSSATNQEVGSAARDAARAAAVSGTAGGATAAAEAVAASSLADRNISCAALSVTLDTSQFGVGGQVTAEVGCTVSLADLSGFGLPGTKVVTGTATAVVDSYRGGTP